MTRMRLFACIGILAATFAAFGAPAVAHASDREGSAPAARKVSVELYVTSWCPHCHRAQRYLQDREIPFVVYDIEKEPQAAQRMRKLNPRGGVPVAVVGEEVIIGFAESVYARALQEIVPEGGH